MSKLILKNICKRYDDNKNGNKKGEQQPLAVDNLSFECQDSEFIGILGPSGCGKSTTLRMIAGLESITSGEVSIDGKVINNELPKDRHIGLAFEDYALYPPLNVFDNIAFNMRAKQEDEEVVKKRVIEIAELMKVTELLNARPATLSGGQMQRVNIARAIVRNPKILLLDEPLSHLDGKMRQILRTEIKRLHKKIHCTTILVTHDQMEAMSLADKIAIIKDGVLQQFGTPEDIYNHPKNEFVANFIGEPPMNISDVEIKKKNNKLFFLFPQKEIMIPVPGIYKNIVKVNTKYRLGIRPMDIQLVTDPKEGTEIPISVFENLGDEQRISFHVDEDKLFTLICEIKRNYKPQDKVRIAFHEERVHLFDYETGISIEGNNKK
jgi:multiple sugar transport system ATP-binding protein